mgnify:CR=1 FL=1
MAKKSIQKTAKKAVKKAAKKTPKAFIIAVVAVVLIIAIAIAVFYFAFPDKWDALMASFLADNPNSQGDNPSGNNDNPPLMVRALLSELEQILLLFRDGLWNG